MYRFPQEVSIQDTSPVRARHQDFEETIKNHKFHERRIAYAYQDGWLPIFAYLYLILQQ